MRKIVIAAFLLLVLFLVAPAFSSFFDEPPTRIVIPRVGISLPVHEAKIVFDTWEVRLDGASFGIGSDLPGTPGNTVIFSHARQGLFESLPKVKVGDEVHVFTSKDWFVYKVTRTMTVEPDHIEVIKKDQPHEITLFTCTGPAWSQRFVVKGVLVADPSTLEN